MSAIKGPAIFLAQFLRDEAPYNSIEAIGEWVASLGYRGVQIPPDPRVFDLDTAATSQTYCDEYRGTLDKHGLEPTELSGHLFGQVLALHPAYEDLFQAFYPEGLRGDQRAAWAADGLDKVIRASANLGLDNIPVMSGGYAWHMMYPWPQRPEGIVDEAFGELARRWRPHLDRAHERGIAFTYELHPGSDVFDGATFETFLDRVDDHPAACINYDPSHFAACTGTESRPSTSRMPSSGPADGSACTAGTSPGPSAPAASAPWATARWTSPGSSPS